MTVCRLTVSLALLFSLLLAAPDTSARAQSSAMLRLSSVEITVGSRATIDAVLDCGTIRCTTFAITLEYDPVLVRVNAVALGSYLGSATSVIEQVIDNNLGEVRFAAVALGAPPQTGSDLLFTMDVTALAAGYTPFTTTAITIGDLEPIPVLVQGGDVEISPPLMPPPTAPAIPTTAPTATILTSQREREAAFTRALDLYIWDFDAQTDHLLVSTGDSYEPDIYADQVVYASAREGRRLDIFGYDLARGVERRLTDDPAQDRHPVLSPDGSQIAFTSDRSGNWEIYRMNADGSNVVNLTNSPAQEYFPSWNLDGSAILFQSDRSGSYQYEMIDLRTNARTQITNYDVPLVGPSMSPDGQWIVGYANVDIPYWVLVRLSDGWITTGTRGVPTDWLSPSTFVYHRADDAAASGGTHSTYTHNVYSGDEALLIPNGIWTTVYP